MIQTNSATPTLGFPNVDIEKVMTAARMYDSLTAEEQCEFQLQTLKLARERFGLDIPEAAVRNLKRKRKHSKTWDAAMKYQGSITINDQSILD